MMPVTVHPDCAARRTRRVPRLMRSGVLLLIASATLGALADPGHRPEEEHRHADHGHGRGNPHWRGPEARYAQPVYVPAPEYYQPQPSPGISLFLPLELIRR